MDFSPSHRRHTLPAAGCDLSAIDRLPAPPQPSIPQAKSYRVTALPETGLRFADVWLHWHLKKHDTAALDSIPSLQRSLRYAHGQYKLPYGTRCECKPEAHASLPPEHCCYPASETPDRFPYPTAPHNQSPEIPAPPHQNNRDGSDTSSQTDCP